MKAPAALAALALLSACPNSENASFENEGQLCLSPQGAPDRFEPNADAEVFPERRGLKVSVTMPTCLSSTCSKDMKAQCAVTVDGPGVLTVQSSGSYRDEGNTCSADCRFLIARCETPPLEPGNYRVRHGNDELMIQIPSTVIAPCTPNNP